MSNHVVDELSAYIDEMLAPQAREQVSRHLRECAVCAATERQLRQIRTTLLQSPTLTPPESFYQGVHERLKKPASYGYSLRALAGACAALLVGVIVHHSRTERQAVPTDASTVINEESKPEPATPAAFQQSESPFYAARKRAAPLATSGLMAKKQKAPRELDRSQNANGAVAGRGTSAKDELRSGDLGTQSVEEKNESEGLQKTMAPTAAAPAEARLKSMDFTNAPTAALAQSVAQPTQTILISSPDEWKSLWNARAPGQPLPAVDFSTQRVVCVVAMQPTQIVRIAQKAGAIEVDYRVGAVSTRAAAPSSDNSPISYRIIPRSAAPVTFLELQ